MASSGLPVIDLSPFLNEGADEGKKKAMVKIGQACSQYGFFQVVNHGVPISLLSQALQHFQTFFEYPSEEKLKLSPVTGAPLAAGYHRQPEASTDKLEYLLMLPPGSNFNVYPTNPPDLREVTEEIFAHFTKIGLLVERILNECLGLPPSFLKEYNHDRSCDSIAALRYFPATDTENNSITGHEDVNCISVGFQDEVGGLEVLKDKEWIPVTPSEGALIVNVGDVIQVLSNNRFKSATHRVVRQAGRSRHSYAFFYNLEGEKWVEPLPQFTREIGEAAMYRGFLYKDYRALRMGRRITSAF